jgi:hypothetical protein
MVTIGSIALGGQNGAYRDSGRTPGRAYGAGHRVPGPHLPAYVPILQSSGQVVAFMTQHLGKPIPSPALMEHIGTRFRKAVESYALANGIPWVRFGKDDRKIGVMQPYLAAQAETGRSGIAAIGVSQEFQRVWTAYQRDTRTPAPQYTFAKTDPG